MTIRQLAVAISVPACLVHVFLRNGAETSTAVGQRALAVPECYEKRRSRRLYKTSVRPHPTANPSRLQNGGGGRGELFIRPVDVL